MSNADQLIVATARRRGCTLVTHNTREFGRVPELALEDWYCHQISALGRPEIESKRVGGERMFSSRWASGEHAVSEPADSDTTATSACSAISPSKMAGRPPSCFGQPAKYSSEADRSLSAHLPRNLGMRAFCSFNSPEALLLCRGPKVTIDDESVGDLQRGSIHRGRRVT